MTTITIKRDTPFARMPAYGSADAGCFDIFAASVESATPSEDGTGAKTVTFDTGLIFDVPEGFVMRVYSRSGHGFKYGIRLVNCTGIIDADYTGRTKVKLIADEQSGENMLAEMMNAVALNKPVAIAQAEIVPVHYWDFAEGEVSKETARGANGFGSTDKANS